MTNPGAELSRIQKLKDEPPDPLLGITIALSKVLLRYTGRNADT